MNQGLHIAFWGSSLVSSYWNGAATYYRGIIRAMAARGHHVTFLEPDIMGRQQNRDMENPEWAEVVVYDPAEEVVFRLLEEMGGADLVVKASGVGIFDELLEREIASLKKPDRMVVFWDVDAPATLDRIHSNSEDPFKSLIPQYDLILTYGGGDPVVQAYKALGARDCLPVYNALDPETHHRVQPRQEYICDLAFLGNRLPDREARVDEFFFKTARLLPERTFILGGNGWEDKTRPGNVRYMGHVPTAHHNAFNSTAGAVLNINRESMARYGFSPATRIFEAAGAGACLITDSWEGIELFLEPGEEILVAGNGKGLAAILKDLTPERSSKIGASARKRILSEHTYIHRAAQLESILGISQTI